MKTLIPFLVFCVVATCNAEPRTWTAVNGKEVEAEFVSNEKGIVKLKLKSGKVFEVPAHKLSKEDNEFIGSLAKPDRVSFEKIIERDGVTYLKSSNLPFTGKSYALHPNGQKYFEVNYKDGKKNGLFVSWDENGKKSSERNLKDGKKEGLEVFWHENGQKSIEGNYKDGKEDGLMVEWYKNGQKSIEYNYEDGKPVGLCVDWHENGQKKWEANCKEGKPVKGSEKFWNSKGESVDTIEEAE